MRTLHVSTRLILGGSQENTVLSCEGQARLGHEVHLAFGPIYGPEGSLLTRVEGFNRRCAQGEETTAASQPCRPITTHIVPSMVRDVSPLNDYRCYWELRGLVAKIRPEIVHTHSSKAGIIGRAAGWAECSAKMPIGVIHTIHGPPFMPVEGGLAQRAKVRVNNTIYTLAERLAAKRCHAIVSVAEAMTREFLSRGIGSPGLYTTVYSGMETRAFLEAAHGEGRDEMRARLGIRPDEFVIGTVARLAQHKGHDDVLDAVAERLSRKSGAEWTLLWVGDGWWRDRLVARARRMNLEVVELDRRGNSQPSERRPATSARLLVTGLVPPERVPGLMRAMDVLAHPSYREGLPRTVPQALLCGVCPIAYDCDGTPEICRDRQTGLLVKTGDKRALGEAIRWAAEHAAERGSMVERGRAECRVKFAAETMVQALEGVYARALGR